jgi:hypothetical protein
MLFGERRRRIGPSCDPAVAVPAFFVAVAWLKLRGVWDGWGCLCSPSSSCSDRHERPGDQRILRALAAQLAHEWTEAIYPPSEYLKHANAHVIYIDDWGIPTCACSTGAS